MRASFLVSQKFCSKCICNGARKPQQAFTIYQFVAEKGSVRVKVETLKKVICMILNGEKISPSMLMTVIRFVMPLQDHTIKKMLLIFWEVVPKYSQDGKMLQEIILVCDAYRKVRVYHFVVLSLVNTTNFRHVLRSEPVLCAATAWRHLTPNPTKATFGQCWQVGGEGGRTCSYFGQVPGPPLQDAMPRLALVFKALLSYLTSL